MSQIRPCAADELLGGHGEMACVALVDLKNLAADRVEPCDTNRRLLENGSEARLALEQRSQSGLFLSLEGAECEQQHQNRHGNHAPGQAKTEHPRIHHGPNLSVSGTCRDVNRHQAAEGWRMRKSRELFQTGKAYVPSTPVFSRSCQGTHSSWSSGIGGCQRILRNVGTLPERARGVMLEASIPTNDTQKGIRKRLVTTLPRGIEPLQLLGQ